MPDPWAEFHLEDIATEHATRHRSAVCPRGFEESLWGLGGIWGPASGQRKLTNINQFQILTACGIVRIREIQPVKSV